MRAHHRPPLRSHWLIGDEARSPEALGIWRRLYEQDPDATAAAGPDWWRMLSDTFAFTNQPRLLIAERGGEPVAAWPLALRTDRGRLLRRRTLTHANGYHTYYGDPVFAADAPTDTLRHLYCQVGIAPGVDFVDIMRLTRCDARSGPRRRLTTSRDHFLDLTTDPPRLQGKQRRELGRLTRRLHAAGNTEMRRVVGPELGSVAARFAELHTALKRRQHQWPVFADSAGADRRFHAAITAAAAAIDLGAVCITLNGHACGILIMAWRNGTVMTWRSAWDPDQARLGLGSLLLAEAIAWCRERGDSGLHLGPGDEPYKADWASETRYVTRWRAARNTPAAGLLRAADLIGRLRAGHRGASAS